MVLTHIQTALNGILIGSLTAAIFPPWDWRWWVVILVWAFTNAAIDSWRDNA